MLHDRLIALKDGASSLDLARGLDMARNTARPLSPHLQIWKWGPHMAVSILNRAMGVGLATAGTAALAWWLVSLASGPDAYAAFLKCAKGWMGVAVLVGLSFAFFLHLSAGIRHFVLDAGAGFELSANRNWAWGTMLAAFTLTVVTWLYITYGKVL
jgi:succinate dehydrogenase / fumarate reductase, cytochrome b subunit